MNKSAIITGASGGIGSETAVALAKKGFDLLICGNSSKESLEETKNRCLKNKIQCHTMLGDMRKSETATRITEKAMNLYGHIDVLVNCAGISKIGLLSDLTDEDWYDILNANLSSSLFMCRQVVPHMVHEKKGHILNVSSIWGVQGASCEVAYSATKGGLNTFTRALAKELAPSNIAVNAIACGMIDTKMNACFSKNEVEEICEEIPAGRMASAAETADFIALLLEASSYMTGQVIGFDGGWS